MRTPQPPPWIAPGALADFHARAGGPVTHPARLVTSHPWQSATGHWVLKLEGIVGPVGVDAVTPARPSALQRPTGT